jgi:hypothetical protein
VFGTLLILPIQGFFNALVYFHSTTKQQPRRSSTAEQATHSSSFIATPFQPWGSFRRLLSGRRSAARTSESIAAAVAHGVMPQEEELQDSEDGDPVVVAVPHDVMPQEEESQDSEEEDPVVVVEPIDSCN